MTQLRAADDFPAIRARMEELRRDRAQVFAEKKGPFADPPEGLSSCREERIGPKPAPTIHKSEGKRIELHGFTRANSSVVDHSFCAAPFPRRPLVRPLR